MILKIVIPLVCSVKMAAPRLQPGSEPSSQDIESVPMKTFEPSADPPAPAAPSRREQPVTPKISLQQVTI